MTGRSLSTEEPLRIQRASIFHFESLASTSDTARGLLTGPKPPQLPFVVTSDLQTAGRGRGSNRWYSDRGSLGLSVAFEPASHGLTPELEPCLCLAFGSLLIHKLVMRGELPRGMAGIRWPNDLEAGGLKFGGLLPERIETTSGPKLVLGIGLNIHTNLDAAPALVARMATSLARLSAGSAGALADYRALVLETLDEALDRLSGQDPDLTELWRAMDLLLDRPVRIRLPDRLVSGIGAGIDDAGRLRVRTEAGIESLAGGIVLRD